MSSLANDLRPTCWAEVVGQPVTVSVLSRQIAEKKIKQAYLFSGPAGTGKTSVARIFAQDLGCEPIELDAASNNGVDSVRAIISDASMSSIYSDYKVYILDECHRFSGAAWDSLLKLIEEPPEGVIFIFCTTEANKVPLTILSRLQRFDFKLVSREEISDRLEYILNEVSHIKYEKAALDRIATYSQGHLRTAIQSLDKCLSCLDNLTLGAVEETLGYASIEVTERFIDGLQKSNSNVCLEIIDNYNKLGSNNLIELFNSIMSYTLDLLIFNKTHNTKYCSYSLSIDYISNYDFNKIKLIYYRCLSFRQLVNQLNVSDMLKTVVLEMC